MLLSFNFPWTVTLVGLLSLSPNGKRKLGKGCCMDPRVPYNKGISSLYSHGSESGLCGGVIPENSPFPASFPDPHDHSFVSPTYKMEYFEGLVLVFNLY